MITRVKVKNFKSFKSLDINLSPISMIVGPNNSGKTNFHKLFIFIRSLVRGSTVFEAALQSYVSFLNLSFRGKGNNDKEVCLEFFISLPDGDEYCYKLEFLDEKAESGHLNIQYEELIKNQKTILKTRNGKTTISTDNFSEEAMFSSEKAALSQLTDINKYAFFIPVRNFLANIWSFDFEPENMRSLDIADKAQAFRRTGRNIANTLLTIKTTSQNNFQKIEEQLCRIIPEIESLDVQVTEPYKHIVFKEKNLDASFTASIPDAVRQGGISL